MSSNKAASLMASLTGDLGEAPSEDSPDQDLFGDIPIDDPSVPGPAPAPFAVSAPAQQAAATLNGSVYHESLSTSAMPQQPGIMQANSVMNQQQTIFPFPHPPQQHLATAPNITYADPTANINNKTSNLNQMSQSQPVMPSSAPAPEKAPPTPTPATKNPPNSLLMNSGLLGDEKKADSGRGGLFDSIDEEEQQQSQAVAAAAAERKREEDAVEVTHKKQEERQRLQQQQPHQYSLDTRMQGMQLSSGQDSSLQQQQENNQGTNQGQQQQAQQMNYPGRTGPQINPQRQQNQVMNQNSMQQPGQSNQMMGHNNIKQPYQQSNDNQVVQQQKAPSQMNLPGVMYRQHPGEMNTSNNHMSPQSPQQPIQNMMSPQQQPGPSIPNRYYTPSTPGVVTAGMHNATSPQQLNSPYGMQHQRQQRVPSQPIQITKPPEVPTYYGKVMVNDPLLLQAPSGFLGMVSSPPHWSYQLTTQVRGQPPSVWIVRRRFRHVVALEDRLRVECPGAILPPRPDKHVSRALEEASTHQSAEFAYQRAAELERYLNSLVVHPEAYGTQALKMFLGLQDDMGTAWPEVSGNAFTRMSAMGSSAAANLSTSGSGFFGTAAPANTTPNQSAGVMSNVMGSVANSVGVGELAEAATEDSAELLALSSSESVRMGAVLQAVPKLEGAVTLLREQGEGAGAVGMELNRLAKEVLTQGDRELSMPLEIFSNGLLRYGRRTKRLGQEIGQATMTSFQLQYKLCRYEKLAWGDRRNALTKRLKERGKADKRAQQLMHHQQQYPPRGGGYGGGGYGGYGGPPHMNQQFNGGNQMDQIVSNATMSDNIAVEAVRQCDEIGERLKREVNRVSFSRRMDWAKSVKVIASYMKEAASERVAIWESTRDTFLQTFPDYNNDTSQWTNVAPSRPAPQMQQPQMQQPQTNMNSSFMGQAGSMSGMGQTFQQPPQPQQPQSYNSIMGSVMAAQAPMGGGYKQH